MQSRKSACASPSPNSDLLGLGASAYLAFPGSPCHVQPSAQGSGARESIERVLGQRDASPKGTMDQQNWLDWGFKAMTMLVTTIVIVTLRAMWRGFWGLVECLDWRKR